MNLFKRVTAMGLMLLMTMTQISAVGLTEGLRNAADRESAAVKTEKDIKVDGDFSLRQLIIKTDDKSIFTENTNIISSYGNVYLAEFDTENEVREAYSYYCEKAEYVEVNGFISVSNEENKGDKEDVTEDVAGGMTDVTESEHVTEKKTENVTEEIAAEEKTEETTEENVTEEQPEVIDESDSLNILRSMWDENEIGTFEEGTIAVIDTGIASNDLVGEISFVDGAGDDNGHGTRIFEYIKEENPEAKVLSVKAMDRNGRGRVSDIYAALEYAISRKASIINLSMSAYSMAGSRLIEDTVRKANENGLIVIGAAGNNGENVINYIPGSIDEAVIIGACDKDGKRLEISNYGDTVDYYMESASTSEAAGRFSGLISKGGYEAAFNSGRVYSSELKNLKAENDSGNENNKAENDSGNENNKGDNDRMNENSKTENNSANDNNDQNNNDESDENADEIIFIAADNYPWLEGHSGGWSYVKGHNFDGYYYFQYYNPDNSLFDTGYFFEVNNTKLNAMCIDADSNSGLDGYEFDINKVDWNDEETKKVVYYSVHNYDYVTAHRVICHYLRAKGRANNDGVGDFSEEMNKALKSSIPENVIFNIYYLNNRAHAGDSGAYQDFITWNEKKIIKTKYYIAVSKKDNLGGNVEGVSFDVIINGSEKKKAMTTGKDGKASYYLGEFASQPTVAVRENWSDKRFVPGKEQKNVKVYKTEAEALSHANEAEWINKRHTFATIEKTSEDSKITDGNPNYSFSGIKYDLYDSGDRRLAEVTLSQSGYKGIIQKTADIKITKTGEDRGLYADKISGKVVIGGLNSGSEYYWKEKNSGENGYMISDTKIVFKAADNDVVTPKVVQAKDKPYIGSIRIHKRLMPVDISGASPEGAEYLVEGKDEHNSSFSEKLIIGEDGYSEKINVPLGNYTVREVKGPNKGNYTLDGRTYHISITQDGGYKETAIGEITVANEVLIESVDHYIYPVDITIEKYDKEGTRSQLKSLKGAVFQAEFYDLNDGREIRYLGELDGVEPYLIENIMTDDEGKASFGSRDLISLGTIVIREIKAPDGYTTENASVSFAGEGGSEISFVGNTVIINYTEEGIFIGEEKIKEDTAIKYFDQVARADIAIRKKNLSSGEVMPGVHFKISKIDSDEEIEIVTDENGYWSSSAIYASHLENTNEIVAGAGTWIYGTEEKDVNSITDDAGAFPLGKYHVEEILPEGYYKNGQVVFDFEITKDMNGEALLFDRTNEKLVDLKTKAWDKDTVSNYALAENGRVLTDTVKMSGLVKGTEYTLVTKLIDKENEEILAEKSSVFKAESVDKEIDIEVDFDAETYAGKGVVFFEYLYKGDITGKNSTGDKKYPEELLIGKHEDINDEGQSIYFPELNTRVEALDGSRDVQPIENVSIFDNVSFKGLQDKEDYRIKGVLMDKSTGERVLIDGNPVISEKTFSAEESDGIVVVDFSFDARSLKGHDVVVFEEVYDKNGYLVAKHADINYAPQTFRVTEEPKTGDTAMIGMCFILLMISAVGLLICIKKKGTGRI